MLCSEISYTILQCLDKVSYLRSAQFVCKAWYDIVLHKDYIFKLAYHEKFPLEICLFSESTPNWRKILHHRRKLDCKISNIIKHQNSIQKISEIFQFGTLGHFKSYFTNIAIYSGKWYYEAIINFTGLAQIGFCSLLCSPHNLNGVGDDIYSYSYDGSRRIIFHGSPHSGVRFGNKWSNGDIVGVCLDITEGTISYYQNGEYLGIAFSDIFGTQPEEDMHHNIPLFPGISLQYSTTSIHYVFDKKKMKYSPPSGYKAIGEGIEMEVEVVEFMRRKDQKK